MQKTIKLSGIVCLIVVMLSLLAVACAPAPAPTPAPAPAPAPAPKPQPVVWKLNSWFPPTHVSAPGLNWAVAEIEKRTEGLLKIVVYPVFSLGFKPSNWLRDSKEGLIDISIIFDMYVCGEEQSLCASEADNLAKNGDQLIAIAKALAPFKKDLYKNIWNSEMLAAGKIPGFSAVIGTKGKQVTSVADLEGLKLRSANSRMTDLLSSVGASPQTLPKGDLYMALKTGVVSGFNSGFGSIYDEKFTEIIDNLAVTGTSAACCEEIIVSPRVWDPLPDNLKKIVREVFEKWAADTLDPVINIAVGDNDRKKVEGAGVKVIDWPQAEKDKFQQKAAELQEKWVNSQGGRVADAWKIVGPIIK